MGKGRTDACARCETVAVIAGRNLCKPCYGHERYLGNLDQWPTTLKTAEQHWVSVDKSDPDGCWLWPRVSRAGSGYGFAGAHGVAHRWSYERNVGPIPDGLVIDHECHNRALDCPGGGPACLHRRCVNPAHLVAKTSGENLHASTLTITHRWANRTHCDRGHEYDEANTRAELDGSRGCRACDREDYHRRKAERLAEQETRQTNGEQDGAA